MYDAKVGQFLSPDPIEADRVNPYRYVENSPTIATDPSGLDKVDHHVNKLDQPIIRWEDENGNIKTVGRKIGDRVEFADGLKKIVGRAWINYDLLELVIENSRINLGGPAGQIPKWKAMAEQINLHLEKGIEAGDNYSVQNFKTLKWQFEKYGIPTAIIDDLLEADHTGWEHSNDGWHYYQDYVLLVSQNDIQLPEENFKGGVGTLLRDNLNSKELGAIQNEMWHAWWDQVLEGGKESEWLRNIFEQEAIATWGPKAGYEKNTAHIEMMDEAASETADILVNAMVDQYEAIRRGAKPEKLPGGFLVTYGNLATEPGHRGKDGKGVPKKWAKEPYFTPAGIKISPKAFRAMLYALEYGHKAPTGVDDPRDVAANWKLLDSKVKAIGHQPK